MTKKEEKESYIEKLFDKPKIISICGEQNSGKSNLAYYFIEELKKIGAFNLYSYGLRVDLKEQKIYSVEELEQIKDSIILCDEFFSLFDLENRKKRREIENSLRLIFHNNNILVLIGTADNFKKFISSKLDVIILKRNKLSNFINGSSIKEIAISYKGSELGSSILNLNDNEALIYDGHYKKVFIPYLQQYDTKKGNVQIVKKCS